MWRVRTKLHKVKTAIQTHEGKRIKQGFRYVEGRCNLSLNLVWIRSYAKVMSFIIHRIWSYSIAQPMNYQYKNYKCHFFSQPLSKSTNFLANQTQSSTYISCSQMLSKLQNSDDLTQVWRIWRVWDRPLYRNSQRYLSSCNSIEHIQIQRREDIRICSSPCFVL